MPSGTQAPTTTLTVDAADRSVASGGRGCHNAYFRAYKTRARLSDQLKSALSLFLIAPCAALLI